ncbi:SurA N-terminal domain-containing protein [Auritidibacter ignavus]|uniref:SurA N-terminal domain-containing protein n=1 Tax=Auritidibacter ignavus TaxID=678932 RepID=UPI0024486C2A|nr:SurA N-terminal domain-containing protein [Auritidibacter ignavus]WGH84913.1 SurA N-terminal domain-containing protein [Auritidibacter ignavus]
MPGKKILSSIALIAMLSLSACNADEENPDGAPEASASAGDQGALPEPNLDDVPDVVATINDTEITKEEFATNYESQYQQMAYQAQMSGSDVDEDQLKQESLEIMIGNELLLQEAEDQDIEVTEDDVDEFLDDFAKQQGLESQDELIAQFEEQGMDEEQLREDSKKQVAMDQLIETLDVDEPSEEELKDLYDEQMEQQKQLMEAQASADPSAQAEDGSSESASGEDQLPSFEESKDDLEEQVKLQNENEAITELVEDLREDADIEIFLETPATTESSSEDDSDEDAK